MSIFKFKQFDVDQTGCAMKINTDGVLLGALAESVDARNVLDIGTGTGVIALMMAQRFPFAIIDAVEIDASAAETARKNFEQSKFNDRLRVYPTDFTAYFKVHPERQYDLIVSNPPFYINSLEAATDRKNLAKHTDKDFFEELMKCVSVHLTANGTCWLVLPLNTAALVKTLATQYLLFLQQQIDIYSFADSEVHRQIIVLGKLQTKTIIEQFVIYDAPKVYSKQYSACLKNFFTIF